MKAPVVFGSFSVCTINASGASLAPLALSQQPTTIKKIVMTISTIRNLENSFTEASLEQQKNSPYCTLTWRGGKLLVRPVGQLHQPYLPATDEKESLVECLKHSPINLVCIDPKLGEARVKFWADATCSAGKPIFLNIRSAETQQNTLSKWLIFLINWVAAFVFLVAASPIMLGLAVSLRVYFKEPVFSFSWHVGKRGKLFRAIKFRTNIATNHIKINRVSGYQVDLEQNSNKSLLIYLVGLIHKYGLDNLPLLFNVLRGEMNLSARHCCSIEDAVNLSREDQRQLNHVPGIISLWQVKTKTNVLRLDSQIL